MRILVYLLFISIFLPESLHGIGLLPRVFIYIPELLSILALGVVILLAVKSKSIYIGPLYLLLFVFIVLNILFGVIVNQVETTTIFAGLRTYFKYLPFFLLPMVYEFTKKEISSQFNWLLVFSLFQLPVALYQRFVLSAGIFSGDRVGGTLGGGIRGSGLLTVYLMCAVTMLLALYLRKRIAPLNLVVIMLMLVIPTMLNETKVTVFLLPIAFLVPALLTSKNVKEKIRRLTGMAVLALAVLGIFIPIYNQFADQHARRGIVEFFTTEGELEKYLLKGDSLIEQGKVGRLDAWVIPFTILPKEPVKLMFGLGIGNVSESFFGEKFAGEYFEKYGGYTYGSMSVIFWETGILGVFFVLFFCYLVFRDSVYLKSTDGIIGDIALGWAGVVCIIILGLFYTNLLASNAISYIFWFYSGLIVSMVIRKKIRT